MSESVNQITVWEKRITDLKSGVEKKTNLIKWGSGLALIAIFGPMVLTGLLAGAAALIISVLIFAAVQLAPAGAKYLVNKRTELLIAEANRHLEALKAEARRSPIETMQNVYLEQGTQLQIKSEQISKFAAKVGKYGQQVSELKRKFPNDAATFDKVHADMTLLLDKRRQKWREAKAAHDQAAHEIERAQAIWEMSQATIALRDSAGDLEAEFMQRIRKETAMDTVQESLASAMAQLDELLMEEIPLSQVERQAIANNPSPALPIVQDVSVKEGVRQ